MDICRDTVLKLYGDILEKSTPETLIKDPKTRLQEYLQSLQMDLPEYSVVVERGEAHDKIFTVRCDILAMTISVQAEGKSKRNAEQAAAQLALDTLNI